MWHIHAEVILNGSYCCSSLIGTWSSMSKSPKICKRLWSQVFSLGVLIPCQPMESMVSVLEPPLIQQRPPGHQNQHCMLCFNIVGCGVLFHHSAIFVYIRINFQKGFFTNRIENLSAKITCWSTSKYLGILKQLWWVRIPYLFYL